ncbi:MBL fold metallo-hydrolase [Candidatus Bathyarchaeota archaeon]|nr:MBL fold metallo-hydrolase [Candidatus Bathyarchaeota archaeon]
MITQQRRTAGIRMVHGGTDIHLDPGPGALVYSNWARLSPQKLDALVVTHCHPDHYTDAEVLVEAMTHGTQDKRGVLAASRSVLQGSDNFDSSVSRYHQNLVKEVHVLGSGSAFEVDDLRFQAMEARHSDADTVGLRVGVPEVGSIGYTSDTAPYNGLGEAYRGCRLLILCVLRPRGKPLKYHLCTDDVLRILEEVKPGCGVLTHFGMSMLNAGPEEEAAYLESETGVPTVSARDGMQIILGEGIEVRGSQKKDEPRLIEA